MRQNKTQQIGNTKFYATEYFSPKDYQTAKVKKTKNTMAIHHYYGSWLTPKMKLKQVISQCIKRILGEKTVKKLNKKRK